MTKKKKKMMIIIKYNNNHFLQADVLIVCKPIDRNLSQLNLNTSARPLFDLVPVTLQPPSGYPKCCVPFKCALITS